MAESGQKTNAEGGVPLFIYLGKEVRASPETLTAARPLTTQVVSSFIPASSRPESNPSSEKSGTEEAHEA